MNSIKRKLIRDFLVIILSTIGLLNLLIGIFIKNYYYANLEKVLENQLGVSTNFYNKYFSDTTLKINIYKNTDAFWSEIDAQVQVIDDKGNLLMDSIGAYDESFIQKSDVKKALIGETSRWIGKVNYTEDKVMAVSEPITVNGKIEGVLRFVISLEEMDRLIFKIQMFFITISFVVFLIGVVLTIVVANKIIRPINNLTEVTKKMARGNLDVRSPIVYNDELGELAKNFNYMADEISKRDQLKNEFISSVSHELRTPLTAIKGWAITLNSDETDDETLKVGFEIIEQETDRLSNMVEELLDFSKLVRGNVELNIKKVNIVNLVEYIENYMQPRASREKIDFSLICEKDKLEYGYFDEDRIKQVLINLLDNAFKFSDINGTVTVQVERILNKLIIQVIDTGCGISDEDLPRVKEKFYKGKNSKSQNGIGLSICDEIVKLHNGEINIESKLGKGTNISIVLDISERE